MGQVLHVERFSIRIGEGVGTLRTRSGDEVIEQTATVQTLVALQDSLKAALDRYARGEQDIIEGRR